MADQAKIVNAEKMLEKITKRHDELQELIAQRVEAYTKGVMDAANYMTDMAQRTLMESWSHTSDILRKEEGQEVKAIGVAEWDRDMAKGTLICSNCGGEAWARKYSDTGAGQQMPSQHCPWCGYEMRAYD